MDLSSPEFDRGAKSVLLTATTTDINVAWRAEIANQSIDHWVHEIKTFAPSGVRLAFDSQLLPSFNTIKQLDFHPDDPGVYADTLGTPDSVYIYPGSANPQTVAHRTGSQGNPAKLIDNLLSHYCNVKHGPNMPCRGRFVSLLRVPIPPTLDPEGKARRRLICRVGEALFSYWICAFNKSGKGSHLSTIAALVSDASPLKGRVCDR
jgi:hypothetical protein